MQIVFSALMLMNLSYFEEFQSIFLPSATKLTVFFNNNKKILESLGHMSELKESYFNNNDMVKHYFTKLENVKDTIDYFQKELDNSVEQLFLALE
jgi:CRISPR/Cas system CMR-associated protein Cmr5 small subunit